MSLAAIPTRQQVAARLPAQYHSYAGISPYYLPVFGHVYTRRLHDCLAAVRAHAVCPTTILDAGCGLGYATAALARLYPQASIYGVDLYPPQVLGYAPLLTPGAARACFIRGSVEAFPLREHGFDLITAFDVLEHIPNPERALDQLARLIRPAGVVVISVPIESIVLRAIRYTVFAGGRLGNISPHWEGSFADIAAFEHAWRARFDPIEVFNTPFRWGPRLVNYDVVFVGTARTLKASNPR
jgi:2-polyprenyl-3-methyl-5-hydroxy-6-metoxy-1,4-benzoquinol methylase